MRSNHTKGWRAEFCRSNAESYAALFVADPPRVPRGEQRKRARVIRAQAAAVLTVTLMLRDRRVRLTHQAWDQHVRLPRTLCQC